MEHSIAKHISTLVKQNVMLLPNQHGFRRDPFTVTQLQEITYIISDALNKTGQAEAIFLRYAKVFDQVSHPKLYLNLKHLPKAVFSSTAFVLLYRNIPLCAN